MKKLNRGPFATTLLLCAVLSLLATLSACSFDFDRANELAPGDVQGIAVDENDVPLAFATVTIEGTTRIQHTDQSGNFLIRGMPAGSWALRVVQDQDGDGYPERSRVQGIRLRYGNIGERSDVGGLSMGKVVVRPVASVQGVVIMPDSDDARSEARVVAVRRFENASQATEEDSVSQSFNETLASESAVGTAGGAFAFAALAEGRVQLVAEYVDPESGETLMGQSEIIELAPGARIEGISLSLLVPLEIPRRAIIHVSPEPDEGALVKVELRTPGSTTDGVTPGPLSLGDPGVFSYSGPITIEDVPPGTQDVVAFTEDSTAFSPARTIPPSDEVTTFHVELRTVNPCSDRDCDDDDVLALCPYGETCENLTLCAAQCQDAFGTAAQTITCTQGADTFDCDDDGDGQPDTTEPPDCLGALLGTDLDGDGICSVVDVVPQCAQDLNPQCQSDPAPQPTQPPPFPGNGTNLPPTISPPPGILVGPNLLQAFTQEGVSQEFGLSALNAEDPEGERVSVILPRAITDEGGSVSLTGADDITNTVLRYTPPANFLVDTFDFVISDGVNHVVYTFRIVLDEADLSPNAADDVFDGEFLEDQAITLNILENDTGEDDIDFGSVSFENVPDVISVEINEEGVMTVIPRENFNGAVPPFGYTVASISGARSEVANINLGEVIPQNDELELNLNALSFAPPQEDTPLEIDLAPGVLEVDGEEVRYFVFPTPADVGVVDIEDFSSVALYTPAPDLEGAVTLRVAYDTDNDERVEGDLVINLAPVDDAPRPLVTELGTSAGGSFGYQIEELFEDIEGDEFDVELVNNPPELNIDTTALGAMGLLLMAPSVPGTYLLELRAFQTGQATLESFVTLTINVAPPDDPVAVADQFGGPPDEIIEDRTVTLDVLANDINSDDVVQITFDNIPTSTGTLTTDNSVITFVPTPNYNGTFSFNYSTLDADGNASLSVTVTVIVTPEADEEILLPQLNVGNIEGDGDVVFNVDDLVDVDVDNETRIYNIGPPAQPVDFGTLSVGLPDQSTANFVPNNADSCGAVQIPVTITFGAQTKSSVVNLEIVCVNDPVVAISEVAIGPFLANQPSPVTFDVLANEEADNVDVGEGLTVSVDGVVNGTLISDASDRNVSVQIDPQFVGTVIVNYTVSDGTFSDSAQLTFEVDPSGALPLAANLSLSQLAGIDIVEDQSEFVIDAGIGDFDPDGEALSWNFDFTGVPAEDAILTSDTGSLVSVNLAENFCGQIQFGKEVVAGARASDPDAVVTVIVACVDDPVQGAPASITLDEDAGSADYSVAASITHVDDDPLGFAFDFAGAPLNAGTFDHPNPAGDFFSYLPADDYCGTFTIHYTVSDENPGTQMPIDIQVTCLPDPPSSEPDTHTFLKSQLPQSIFPLNNDNDPDGEGFIQSLTLSNVPGFVSVNGAELQLTAPAQPGDVTEVFDYFAQDNLNRSFQGTVTITIEDDNAPPVANDDSFIFVEDESSIHFLDVIGGLGLDSDDAPLSELTLTFEGSPPPNMVINGNIIEFTPPPDFTTPVTSFDYRITDAGGLFDIGTVLYEVTPLNDPPVAVADNFDIFAPSQPGLGDPVNFDVVGNDTDVDIGDVLSVTNINCQDPEVVATVVSSVEVAVSIIDGAAGSFTCAYDLSDNFALAIPQGTITLNVLPPPPDETLILLAGTTQTIDLSSSSGPSLSADPALSGVAPQVSGDTVDYSAPAGFVGRDKFRYKRSILGSNDGEGEVSVQVLTPPHPTTETFTASGATPTGTGLPFYGMAAGMVGGNPFAFGGTNGLDFSNASQEFIGTSWSSAIALTPPSPRAFMASTPSQGGFMIYGGQLDDASFSDELWEFSASAWNQLTPTGTAPPKLRGASMVQFEFNATTMTLLMGGEMDNGQINQDIYLLQQNTWEIIFPDTTAFFRSDASLVRISDDPFNGSPRFMYSGGYDGFGPSSQNDLFTFDEFSPGQFQINVGFIGTLPVATIGHQVVPDPNNTTPPLNYILLGGMSRKGFAGESRAKGEVYEITDPAGNGFWVPSSHLMQKTAFGAAIARTSDVLLVGGDLTLAEQDFQNDTLHISLEHDITVTQAVNGTSPPPRDGAAMAEVPGGVVLVGGRGATDILNDVWRYSSASQQWTQLANAPFQVRDMAIARNPVDGLVYGHGGFDDTNANNDKTWVFDPDTDLWTEVLSAGGPLIGGAQMVHSPGLNSLVMYGGGELGDGLQADINTYRFNLSTNTWTTISTTFPDLGREEHNLVAGDMNGTHYILMLNGTLDGAGFTEVFRFNETLLTWELQSVGGLVPPQVFNAVMAYDPITSRFVLHSGAQEPGGSLLGNHQNTYELQEGTGPNDLEFAERIFMRASPPDNPERRAGASMAFDGEGLLIFGGRGIDLSTSF